MKTSEAIDVLVNYNKWLSITFGGGRIITDDIPNVEDFQQALCKAIETMKLLDDYKDCGSAGFSEFYHGYNEKITFLIDKNQVTVNVKYNVYGGIQNTNYTSTPFERDCNSKGAREKEIKLLLQAGDTKK